jgi:hypothetical protein
MEGLIMRRIDSMNIISHNNGKKEPVVLDSISYKYAIMRENYPSNVSALVKALKNSDNNISGKQIGNK